MRVNFRSKGCGWFKESYRHSLASHGIKSSLRMKQNFAVSKLFMKGNEQVTMDDAGVVEKSLGLESSEAKQEMARPESTFLRRKKDLSESTYRGVYGRELIKRKIGAMPFADFVDSVRSGSIDKEGLQYYLREAPERRQIIANAALDGAKSMVSQGFEPDWQMLREAGVNESQIDNLRLKAGSVSMQAAKVGAEVRGGLVNVASQSIGAVEGGIEGEMKQGAKMFRDAPTELSLLSESSSAFGPINKAQPKVHINAYGEEEVDSPGMLNPLAIGGLDDEIKRREKVNQAKTDRMKGSEKVDYFVNDLFSGKTSLSKVDFSAYNQGLDSYKKGDREGLMKSIMDLEGVNYALKNKVALINNIHMQILSNKNVTETLLRGKDSVDSGFFNPLVSAGTGSEHYSNQVDKLSKTFIEVQKSSNAVSQRIADLKRKYSKMNQMAQLDMSLPEREVRVFGDSKPNPMNHVVGNPGIFKHNNVVLGTIKDIKEEQIEDVNQQQMQGGANNEIQGN